MGVAALALMGVLHGLGNKPEVPPASPAEIPPANASAQEVTNAAVDPQTAGNIAMTAEEQAEAAKQKDLDAVNDALGNGQGDMQATLEIANRLENKDPEVRTAAREAAAHLGDTNIIPYLVTALSNLQDPREKVAILDTIEYLKIAPIPESYANAAMEAMLTNTTGGAKFGPQAKRPAKPKAASAPAAAPAAQPAADPQGTP